MNQLDDLTDELISAYFDGESSVDERSRVECLLAQEGRHRQVYSDLRTLQLDMRALPYYTLEDDFFRSVLRQAVRAGLTLSDRQSTAPARARPRKSVDTLPAGARSRWSWRTFVLPALAVAACLLLVLHWSGQSRRPGTAARAPESLARAPESFSGNALVADRSKMASPSPAKTDSYASPPVDTLQTAAGLDAARGSSDSGNRTAGVAPGGPSRPESLAGRPAATGGPPSKNRHVDADAATGSLASAANAKYLLAIELLVTSLGMERKAFDEVMSSHYILYDRSLQVEQPLEEALLASRFLEDVVKAAPGGAMDPEGTRASPPAAVELVYVVAAARPVEEAAAELQARTEEFAAVKFNLAVKPADISVFEQLRQSVSLQLADAGVAVPPSEDRSKPAADFAQPLGRARRLVMQAALLSRLPGRIGALGLMLHSDERPAVPRSLGAWSQDGQTPKASGGPIAAPPWAATDGQYEVLFVLHQLTRPDGDSETLP